MATQKREPVSNFNIEFEKNLLGEMLIKDGEIIPAVAQILEADDLYRPEHKLTFSLILETYKNNSDHIDILLLIEAARKKGVLALHPTKRHLTLIFFTALLNTDTLPPTLHSTQKVSKSIRRSAACLTKWKWLQNV